MSFDTLPGYDLNIPVFRPEPPPAPAVVPTAELIKPIVQNLQKIGEMNSPEEQMKRKLLEQKMADADLERQDRMLARQGQQGMRDQLERQIAEGADVSYTEGEGGISRKVTPKEPMNPAWGAALAAAHGRGSRFGKTEQSDVYIATGSKFGGADDNEDNHLFAGQDAIKQIFGGKVPWSNLVHKYTGQVYTEKDRASLKANPENWKDNPFPIVALPKEAYDKGWAKHGDVIEVNGQQMIVGDTGPSAFRRGIDFNNTAYRMLGVETDEPVSIRFPRLSGGAAAATPGSGSIRMGAPRPPMRAAGNGDLAQIPVPQATAPAAPSLSALPTAPPAPTMPSATTPVASPSALPITPPPPTAAAPVLQGKPGSLPVPGYEGWFVNPKGEFHQGASPKGLQTEWVRVEGKGGQPSYFYDKSDPARRFAPPDPGGPAIRNGMSEERDGITGLPLWVGDGDLIVGTDGVYQRPDGSTFRAPAAKTGAKTKLTVDQRRSLQSLGGAGEMLEDIGRSYDTLSKKSLRTGPVGGLVQKGLGAFSLEDPEYARAQVKIATNLFDYARALNGSGVLTDRDLETVRPLIPQLNQNRGQFYGRLEAAKDIMRNKLKRYRADNASQIDEPLGKALDQIEKTLTPGKGAPKQEEIEGLPATANEKKKGTLADVPARFSLVPGVGTPPPPPLDMADVFTRAKAAVADPNPAKKQQGVKALDWLRSLSYQPAMAFRP